MKTKPNRIQQILFLFIIHCFCLNVFCKQPLSNGQPNSKSWRKNEYSIFSLREGSSSDNSEDDSALMKEREQLYEAYNLLHSLAQDFHKPFDAPAVIVVGHQTSGKSALIEALMGFQFNQVGGGTKTRRPVALRMQYNPNCATPMCFLTLENGKEEQRSLADIQAYIEAENKRLERDSTRSFDSREINIRMEYRYCPNMIVIDTPGMLHAPKGKQLTPQQRALAQAAREAEALVLSKIRCQDYIILCVEDTTDWKHATTRNIVMQADPTLTRTVLVTTKFDTKFPQFSEPEDLEEFLRAPLIHSMYGELLGGPFFTSVPAGRVGNSREFDTNEAFVYALQRVEKQDRANSYSSLGPIRSRYALNHLGVSRLRTFLENRVEDCYRRNVAKIVPILQTELRLTESKLQATEEELNALSVDRLKKTANLYREKFSKELSNAIQGTVKASPAEWGESLDIEQLKGGSFLQNELLQQENWQRILDLEVGNNRQKLFGGAQYHRALREFTIAVRHMPSPTVSEDEIANAAGIGDTHNGVNFMRAACVIAMEKAQCTFDPMLEALRHRSTHIMKRIFPAVAQMVRKSNFHSPSITTRSMGLNGDLGGKAGNEAAVLDMYSQPFQELMRRIYEKFVDEVVERCLDKCRDDLHGMTRFVTWDVEDKGGSSSLYRMLPTPQKVVEVYSIAMEKKQENSKKPKAIANGPMEDLDELNDDDEDFDDYLDEDNDDDEDEFDGPVNPRKPWWQLGGGDEKVSKSKNKRETGKRQGRRASADDDDDVAEMIFSEWNQANTKKMKNKKNMGLKQSNSKNRNNKLESVGKNRKPVKIEKSAFNSQSSVAVKKTDDKKKPGAVEDAELSDYYQVMQLTEEMLSGSNASRTSTLVQSLVQFIVSSWRNHFARSTAMKFNCFFLMPFLDEFPEFLRSELDKMYESGMSEMFDIEQTRRQLRSQREELLAECEANSKLQQRFDLIASQLKSSHAPEPTDPGAEDLLREENNLGSTFRGGKSRKIPPKKQGLNVDTKKLDAELRDEFLRDDMDDDGFLE